MTPLESAIIVFKQTLRYSITGRSGDYFSFIRNLDEALMAAIETYNRKIQ